ncbi:MAG: RagB/SusD family nutrient uptake outer membrane protein [Bacteroidales bacterium]|nr:RagB/SusD family nutrient uptake outer membrane protein [Bacteroidales bacterium]
MKKIFQICAIVWAALFVVSCDLSEYNPNEYSPALAFANESAIQLAINNFYSNFPSVTGAYSKDGSMDYVCTPFSFSNRYCVDFSAADSDLDWSGWDDLRDINYFLEQMNSPACGVEGDVWANFYGQGRFFRAFWYYRKMRSYGDLPLVDHVIRSNEPDYEWQDRTSRDVIFKFILDDLDYAIDNVTATSVDNTTITRDICLFIKMQACLYEASFRKYNNITASAKGEPFTNYTVEELYRLSAEAAEQIINGGKYSLISNFRDLFLSETLQTKEVLLGAQTAPSIKGSQNNYYNAASVNRSFVRTFINTFLMKDGSLYTAKSGFETETFATEFNNRDPRLASIVRTPGYKFNNATAVPVIPAPSPVGYHIIKFTIDEYADGADDSKGGNNPNSTPIYRYPEVLLSYAEAKAELGEMTADIWSKTVGAIRRRAGITGNLDLPTTVDPYLKANFYPDVDNPVIMEIRRERGCELCLEGMRENDLLRWGCGSLLATMPWTGINIPALNAPVDLDGDGNADYYFAASAPGDKLPDGVTFVQVNGTGLQAVPNGNVYQLRYDCNKQRNWDANNRLILSPIPQLLVDKYKDRGYTLTQNPGY